MSTTESTALALRDEDGGMTVEGMVRNRRKVKRVIEEIMEEGVHYGRIPGCGPKPALYKGGAEVLCQTFGLAPKYAEPIIVDLGGHHREVRIQCSIVHVATGAVFSEGLGSCSTVEKKYRKNEPADVYNTVLKMAAKRAMVMGVIAATGTSDVLTQDLEDDADHEPPQRQQPQRQAPPRQMGEVGDEPDAMKAIETATTDRELASLAPQLAKLPDAWRKKARAKYGEKLVELRKAAEATERQAIRVVRDEDVPPQESAS